MTKETISSSRWINPLLHLNLHVGGIAWGFLLSAARWQGESAPPALQLLVFCAAVAVYGLDRTGNFSPEDRINAPDRCEWLGRHRRLQWAVILTALAGVLISLTQVPAATRHAALGYALFAAAYARPLLPGRKRLQDFARIKLPCIVLGWALLPALQPDLFDPAWTLYRIGWLIPNVLWSEWLDHPGDRKTPRPAPPWRISLVLMLVTIGLGLWIGAGRDLFGPGLYLVALLAWAPKNPMAFARRQDLFLLASLVSWGPY
jgi:hypothetical protein